MSLDENEIKRFMELLDNKPWDEDFKRIIKVLLYTGMRSGECLGLMWEDIDFEEMTITINHNLTDIGGKHTLGSPKTQPQSDRYERSPCFYFQGAESLHRQDVGSPRKEVCSPRNGVYIGTWQLP